MTRTTKTLLWLGLAAILVIVFHDEIATILTALKMTVPAGF